jgi:chemotaxis signal transduction protein
MNDVPVTDWSPRLAARALELRAAFEHSFVEPARIDATIEEDFLSVRVADDVFAIRLCEIAGLHAGKKVTRVPGGDPALIGLAGFRGAIQPVYSLAVLLGLHSQAVPRWLVIAASARLALAFDGFEQHLRVPPDRIRPVDASAKDQPYVRDFMRIQHFIRPILHLPSILDAIRTRGPAAASTEER